MIKGERRESAVNKTCVCLPQVEGGAELFCKDCEKSVW